MASVFGRGLESMHPDPSYDSVTVRRLTNNAFFVLELSPEATAGTARGRADALVADLRERGDDASLYPTPLGLRRRDEMAVRRAASMLGDPKLRVQQAFWASGSAVHRAADGDARRGWSAAKAAFGWRRR